MRRISRLKIWQPCSWLCLLLCAASVTAADDWQWSSPLPQGRALRAVWVAPTGAAFAVGENNTILQLDGHDWTVVHTGPSSEDHVYRYGLLGVWGSSATNVFAVGEDGTILHYDGVVWSGMDSGTNQILTSIWGSSPNDVYVGAGPGTLSHFDGSSWTNVSLPTDQWITAIWGSSASDVFVVGDRNTIVHFDGETWSPMVDSSDLDGRKFNAVWGSAPDNVYAVGEQAGAMTAILHYDGEVWAEVPEGTISMSFFGDSFSAVWGSSADDVWVIGTTGTVLHFDGSRWSSEQEPAGSAISGSSEDDIWAVYGHRLVHFNGSAWSLSNPAPVINLTDVWGSSQTDVYAVGTDACLSSYCDYTIQVVAHYDGLTWSELETGYQGTAINDIWGSSPDDIYVVGWGSSVLHYDGSDWSDFAAGLPVWINLTDVWGSSANDVYTISSEGVIYRSLGGNPWQPVASTNSSLSAIWGAGANDVFAVGSVDHGSEGTIEHFDGSTWSSMVVNSPGLSAIWGVSGTSVFATGKEGTILHFDGHTWSAMDSGTDGSLKTVWGTSSSNVYAAGDDGTILHFDGSSWSPMSDPASGAINAIWGSSDSDVFAVGRSGTILHHGSRETTVLIPGAARASGEGGSFFTTGLEVHNPGSTAARYQLWWLPRNQNNSTPMKSNTRTLAGGHSERFEDVVADVFGLSNAVGSLAVASTAGALNSTSRTAANVGEGSFGQIFAGVEPGQLISSGEHRRIIFLSDNQSARSNLGLVNATHRALTVQWQSFAADGTALASGAAALSSFANIQVNHVLGSFPIDSGYVDVWTDTAEAWFTAYGSVLDNTTSDPITVLPASVTAAESYLVAAVARISGYHDTFYTTDLEIHNPGLIDVEYTMTYLPRASTEAVSLTSQTYRLGPGTSVRYTDVLGSVFALGDNAAGALLVHPSPGGALIIMSRTFTSDNGGSFGQAFAGIPDSSFIDSNQRRRILYLAEDSNFRTNLGLVNCGDRPIIVQWQGFTPDGDPVVGGSIELLNSTTAQLDRVFSNVAPISGAYIEVWTESPGSFFVAYASVLDNGTSDPITVLPVPAPAVPLPIPGMGPVGPDAARMAAPQYGVIRNDVADCDETVLDEPRA